MNYPQGPQGQYPQPQPPYGFPPPPPPRKTSPGVIAVIVVVGGLMTVGALKSAFRPVTARSSAPAATATTQTSEDRAELERARKMLHQGKLRVVVDGEPVVGKPIAVRVELTNATGRDLPGFEAELRGDWNALAIRRVVGGAEAGGALGRKPIVCRNAVLRGEVGRCTVMVVATRAGRHQLDVAAYDEKGDKLYEDDTPLSASVTVRAD